MEKYEKILNANYKEKVMNMIETEVKEKIKNMPQEEIKHFCSNVYTMATLSVNHISEQEIADQIMISNNKFINDCMQKGITINPEISEEQLQLTTSLKDKYIKVIANYQ